MGVVLVAVLSARAAGIPALVLMLGPGVAVPLGLAFALSGDDDHEVTLPRRLLVVLAPIGAAAGVLGWISPPGYPMALALALLHGVVCALSGTLALVRLYGRRPRFFAPLHELVIDVGLGLLPVAGVWFVASRSAMPLIGFQEPVVTFTAAHFHFAGFCAPVILGGTGRFLFGGAPDVHPTSALLRSLYRVAAVAVCAGVPLTAIGIATNHTIESIAAILLASGMLCASVVLVVFASRRAFAIGSKLAGALFIASGGTLLLTMSLAATFALSSSAGRGSSLTGAIPLQTMIDWHGGANAIGFSLAGLAALTLVDLARIDKAKTASTG